MRCLADLLHPLKTEEFLASHFEQAPVHISTIREPLLSLSSFDALITATAATAPRRLRANLGGQVLAPPPGATSAELYGWAKDVYASGSTLVLNYVEMLDLRCGALAFAIGEELRARVTFTVFITPASGQGFAPHFDTLDVFVIQVHGSKMWHLGEVAVRLPTPRQGYLVEFGGSSPAVRHELTMEPGHVLYIPRGVVHWARTTGDASVHITAEIDTATIGDVLATAVRTTPVQNSGRQLAPARSQRLIHASGSLSPLLGGLIDSLPGSSALPGMCLRARTEKWARER
jgi:hypothetical protein